MEQYDYDVIKAREDYETAMRNFDIAVFDFVNLEKVKRLQGFVCFMNNNFLLVKLGFYCIFIAGLWIPCKWWIWRLIISVALEKLTKLNKFVRI